MVMAKMADNQHYYMIWKMEEAWSVGLLRVTVEYSVPEDLVLWHEF